jgi:hypothetical protein
VALPLAVAGEAGHRLLERIGDAAAHHAFHLVFGLLAVGIFAAVVARDIRRHGRPVLSWRLRPRPAPQAGRRLGR